MLVLLLLRKWKWKPDLRVRGRGGGGGEKNEGQSWKERERERERGRSVKLGEGGEKVKKRTWPVGKLNPPTRGGGRGADGFVELVEELELEFELLLLPTVEE